MLEFDSVFTAFDGVYLNADHLNMIFVQNAGFVQFGTQIQPGLPAQVRKKGVGTLLGDNLFQTFHIQRLNVGDVSGLRIGHDGGGVGIDQHNFITQFFQRFTGLRT